MREVPIDTNNCTICISCCLSPIEIAKSIIAIFCAIILFVTIIVSMVFTRYVDKFMDGAAVVDHQSVPFIIGFLICMSIIIWSSCNFDRVNFSTLELFHNKHFFIQTFCSIFIVKSLPEIVKNAG